MDIKLNVLKKDILKLHPNPLPSKEKLLMLEKEKLMMIELLLTPKQHQCLLVSPLE